MVGARLLVELNDAVKSLFNIVGGLDRVVATKLYLNFAAFRFRVQEDNL